MNPDEIKTIRRHLGLSQRDFARKLGVHFTSVARWETGKIAPSSLAVQAIKLLLQAEGGKK